MNYTTNVFHPANPMFYVIMDSATNENESKKTTCEIDSRSHCNNVPKYGHEVDIFFGGIILTIVLVFLIKLTYDEYKD